MLAERQTTNGENNNTNVYTVFSDEISPSTCLKRKYAPPLFPAVFIFPNNIVKTDINYRVYRVNACAGDVDGGIAG